MQKVMKQMGKGGGLRRMLRGLPGLPGLRG
jgi:hypothetical protein